MPRIELCLPRRLSVGLFASSDLIEGITNSDCIGGLKQRLLQLLHTLNERYKHITPSIKSQYLQSFANGGNIELLAFHLESYEPYQMKKNKDMNSLKEKSMHTAFGSEYQLDAINVDERNCDSSDYNRLFSNLKARDSLAKAAGLDFDLYHLSEQIEPNATVLSWYRDWACHGAYLHGTPTSLIGLFSDIMDLSPTTERMHFSLSNPTLAEDRLRRDPKLSRSPRWGFPTVNVLSKHGTGLNQAISAEKVQIAECHSFCQLADAISFCRSPHEPYSRTRTIVRNFFFGVRAITERPAEEADEFEQEMDKERKNSLNSPDSSSTSDRNCSGNVFISTTPVFCTAICELMEEAENIPVRCLSVFLVFIPPRQRYFPRKINVQVPLQRRLVRNIPCRVEMISSIGICILKGDLIILYHTSWLCKNHPFHLSVKVNPFWRRDNERFNRNKITANSMLLLLLEPRRRLIGCKLLILSEFIYAPWHVPVSGSKNGNDVVDPFRVSILVQFLLICDPKFRGQLIYWPHALLYLTLGQAPCRNPSTAHDEKFRGKTSGKEWERNQCLSGASFQVEILVERARTWCTTRVSRHGSSPWVWQPPSPFVKLTMGFQSALLRREYHDAGDMTAIVLGGVRAARYKSAERDRVQPGTA
ncbi:uncharacterized protein BDR25DRAFT_391916 [Lindgomyces ingoldianus]|uniref:Uncharacterized protein n=1 Tax=Lindgomyces ingoldianus TaxID=673940 RepID=A0ACB6R4Q3_9PLEO|nr:uncharacterized protein BDR25DRAFT_391916 [Lindgomyces ingoldianus]KAF2474047.1 hypothetical protein BDR25DRAFT_391916 [Lindgomyces ingoldianus]